MCIFCNIVKKEIPAEILYEDEDIMAFLDISQVTRGHTLIIPKKHYDTLLSCDIQILQQMMKVAQKLGKHSMEVLHAQGMNILSNAGEIAGQSVPHFHIHLIPRYGDDDSCIIEFKDSEPQDLNSLRELLKI